MFQIKKMDTPESVPFAGGVMNLTHTSMSINIDPRAPRNALVVVLAKGYLNDDGSFQEWGTAEISSMDAQGLDAMIASTEGGKRAGVFRTDDILPAIAKRAKEVEAAQEAAALEELRSLKADELRSLKTRPKP